MRVRQAYRNALGSGVAERMGARTTMEDLFAKVDGIWEEEIDHGIDTCEQDSVL
jgi:hypothetical protein